MRATATRAPKPSGEAELQRAWAEGPLPLPLRCLDGEPLRVIFHGRANGGPGPDFRNAIFLNGKQHPVRGDVELHCRLADWWAHGHASDPAYRAVTLHVVAAGGGANRGARPVGGRIAELRAIEPGARPPVAVERCCALALTRQPRALRAALTRLGRRRLRMKALGLQRALQGASPTPESHRDQVAYEALLQALGQGGTGTAALRALARSAPLAELPAARPGDASRLATILLRGYETARRAPWDGQPPSLTPARPANSMERRLRAAARLIAADRAIAARFAALASAPPAEATRDLSARSGLSSGAATQLLVDAAYPFALAAAGAAAAKLEQRWLTLPGAHYGRTKTLRAQLTAAGLQDWRNGCTQGLLALERGYCSCGAAAICPLRPFRAQAPQVGAAPEQLVQPMPPVPSVQSR
ncbi:MAG: DUF2851 family protein [Chloroflexi bacterium]|nr:DUF2851 family protein [Chloroflexota bacterium]